MHSKLKGTPVTAQNFPTSGLKASDKVFGKTDRKAKEIEKLTGDIKKTDDEIKSVKQKMTAVTTKLSSLEKDLKEAKLGDAYKAKLLIEKSENADKLISALKQEVVKLKKTKESTKGDHEEIVKPSAYVILELETILI